MNVTNARCAWSPAPLMGDRREVVSRTGERSYSGVDSRSLPRRGPRRPRAGKRTALDEISFAARYCREERWDIFNRAIQILRERLEGMGRRLDGGLVGRALLDAGLTTRHGSLRPSIAPLARSTPRVRLTAYSDGTFGIDATESQ